MKCTIKHIVSALTAIVYVSAFMGFGIHRCHAEGATYFVPMFGDTSFEAIHHSHNDHHHDHHSHHGCEGHCCDATHALSDSEDNCNTELFRVQDFQSHSSSEMQNVSSFCTVILPDSANEFLSAAESNARVQWYSTPPPLGIKCHSLLSVWRL